MSPPIKKSRSAPVLCNQMPHASTVAAGSRILPGKANKMADVAAGSSANVCSSDEFSSDGEVEITSEEPMSMLQKQSLLYHAAI